MNLSLTPLSAVAIAAVLCLGPPAGEAAKPPFQAAIEYVDIAAQVGLKFQDVTGASGRRYFPETMGSGVGFVDFDGDQDLYLTYYGTNVMYRNEGDGGFTKIGGLARMAYGQDCQ